MTPTAHSHRFPESSKAIPVPAHDTSFRPGEDGHQSEQSSWLRELGTAPAGSTTKDKRTLRLMISDLTQATIEDCFIEPVPGRAPDSFRKGSCERLQKIESGQRALPGGRWTPGFAFRNGPVNSAFCAWRVLGLRYSVAIATSAAKGPPPWATLAIARTRRRHNRLQSSGSANDKSNERKWKVVGYERYMFFSTLALSRTETQSSNRTRSSKTPLSKVQSSTHEIFAVSFSRFHRAPAMTFCFAS
jgi:hypothetical protein